MDRTKISVLFIEPNSDNATLVRLLLDHSASIQVRQVKDLQKAEVFLEKESADVILLDLELPETEVVSSLAAAIKIAGETPIVAIVGADITPLTLLAVRAGVGDYLIRNRLNQADLTEAMFNQARRRRPIEEVSRTNPTSRVIRVLVVEDNPGDAALIRQALNSTKRRRFDIVHVVQLSSALECIHRPLDVVLLDLDLPDSQDLQSLHRMRSVAPYIPIIIVTGIQDRSKAVEALANGAQDFLVKGHVDGHLLERAILRCVDLYRPGHRAESSKSV